MKIISILSRWARRSGIWKITFLPKITYTIFSRNHQWGQYQQKKTAILHRADVVNSLVEKPFKHGISMKIKRIKISLDCSERMSVRNTLAASSRIMILKGESGIGFKVLQRLRLVIRQNWNSCQCWWQKNSLSSCQFNRNQSNNW
jgi:hypothetical protein